MECNSDAMMMDLFGPTSENEVEIADEETCEEESQEDEMLENGPQKDMVFESIESLLALYQAHGMYKGFAISIRTNRKNKYLVLCCNRARKSIGKKGTKRVNCPARINAIKQENGTWKVSTVYSTHNHDLNPETSTFIPAHRKLTINMRRQLGVNDMAGLQPCNNFRLMKVRASGPQMAKVYKLFQECIDMAYDCQEKMQFIKQRCKEMKNELKNWRNTNSFIESNYSATERRAKGLIVDLFKKL